jgi:hypothetical protein
VESENVDDCKDGFCGKDGEDSGLIVNARAMGQFHDTTWTKVLDDGRRQRQICSIT